MFIKTYHLALTKQDTFVDRVLCHTVYGGRSIFEPSPLLLMIAKCPPLTNIYLYDTVYVHLVHSSPLILIEDISNTFNILGYYICINMHK